ncbi:OmpA family protein [Draconibacterium sp.]|nr:OmpA family protein [Draconibacterium sp.]
MSRIGPSLTRLGHGWHLLRGLNYWGDHSDYILLSHQELVMKNYLAATSAFTLSALLVVQPASAIETSTKQDLTALTTIAVATAAAGPVGFILGGIGAGWMVDQVAAADELAVTEQVLVDTQADLASAYTELDQVNADLAMVQQEQEQFAKLALEQLQLEMLFKTNDSRLTAGGENRLALLATFLKRNTGLTVRIEGYADPRGDSASNMALSLARAERVAQQLLDSGVASNRMTVSAHGESQALAIEGDTDAYALDRRVHIALDQGAGHRQVAEVTLSGA